MSMVVILVGLGYCTLLVAVGLAVWGGLRDAPRVSRGTEAAAWAAGGLLVFGALLAWGSRLPALEGMANSFSIVTVEGPVSSMVLMAALAIPLEPQGRRGAHWSRSLLYVPAVVLSGVALVLMTGSSEGGLVTNWITPIRFLLAVCAGLGARTLGQALQVIAAGSRQVERPGAFTYGFLTLVLGSVALVNLWQRGTVWSGVDPVMRGGVVGAWLAWSAGWLASSWHLRLRALVMAIAALLLMVTAANGA
ncbi:MAG: hypothetical protein R6X31_06825 [Anaerolineae bacterium]